jgi:NAD(P)-dependent dehydrogenase (short-subunit alcohol dehydrogenase family)
MPKDQIIITGASRGIGAAIACDLEGRGYPVIGLSRSGETAAGRGIKCDMTDEAAVRKAFADIASSGPVKALISNAGLHLSSPSADLATDEYEAVMAINATSVMVGAREIYPHLKAGDGGAIINMGSFFDKMGVPANLAYCASKAAVAAMSRCMAVEWAADGVRVLNIAPGYIATDLNQDFLAKDKVRRFLRQRIPAGGAGTAEDVARLVGALIDESIPFLTGETIYLDGGQGMNH